MVFTHDMSDWLGFNINKAWLEENISWRDFGTGVRLGKLKREEKCSLVLYDADSEVTVDAFMPHMHPKGLQEENSGKILVVLPSYSTGDRCITLQTYAKYPKKSSSCYH